MTTNHKYYLDLAFKIAEINLGKTKLNPSVGLLLLKIIQLFHLALHH